MVRSPGFEPGSSTWQADVLNQARLRPLVHVFRWFRESLRLFKFSEEANALFIHNVLETCLYELFCLVMVGGFLANVAFIRIVGLAELSI